MLITDKILSLWEQLKFRDDTSELEAKIKELELQLKKSDDALKDMMDTALTEHISNQKLQTEVKELKTKNNNQSMNLVALRASSKTEIKKLKYQLHMANNRVQILDSDLQARKNDAIEVESKPKEYIISHKNNIWKLCEICRKQ